MGCSCNSNFSNFSRELKAKVDIEQYEDLLSSNAMSDIGKLQGILSIWENRSNPQGEELELLNTYKKRATARQQVLGMIRNADMIAGTISTNKGNPNFNVSEYEEKLKVANEKVEEAKKEYNKVSGIVEDEASEEKTKPNLLKMVGIGTALGLVIFVGFKLYKKYK